MSLSFTGNKIVRYDLDHDAFLRKLNAYDLVLILNLRWLCVSGQVTEFFFRLR